MRQYLKAQIQALSESELDGIVDPAIMSRIKGTDPKPDIRVYSIGHEGESNMNLPGIGKKTITWIQAAVQWLSDKVKIGTAVFNRHNPESNSHEGRQQIGEVVGKTTKKIGDRLSALAAIHIFPNFKSRPLDVASIEAEIEYDHDDKQAWPTQIFDVSGIALSNSGIDSPGFPGATFLGAVQAFVQAFGEDIGEKKMNQSDVLAAVKELKLTPVQVFGIDNLMEDPAVVKKVKEAKSTLTSAADRFKGEVDVLREKNTGLENDKAEAVKQLQKTKTQSKSVSVLETILASPEVKVDDRAKKYIQLQHKTFSSEAEDEAGLQADVIKFIESKNSEYNEIAKDVFDVTSDNDEDPANVSKYKLPQSLILQDPKNTTVKNDVLKPVDEKLTEEMNPDSNPLIIGGKAAQEALKT